MQEQINLLKAKNLDLKRENSTKTEIIKSISPKLQGYKNRDWHLFKSLNEIMNNPDIDKAKSDMKVLIANMKAGITSNLLVDNGFE